MIFFIDQPAQLLEPLLCGLCPLGRAFGPVVPTVGGVVLNVLLGVFKRTPERGGEVALRAQLFDHLLDLGEGLVLLLLGGGDVGVVKLNVRDLPALAHGLESLPGCCFCPLGDVCGLGLALVDDVGDLVSVHAAAPSC